MAVMFWSAPGEISAEGCWVIFAGCHLFTGRTRREVLLQWVDHAEDDRYLVG